MSWVTKQIRWIMMVSGALTCTMLHAAFAPTVALTSNFGSSLTGPVADVVVRNWAVLVGLVGVMLIYGAFDATVRRFVLWVAGISKLTFIGLVLTYGRDLLAHQVRVAVAVDAIWVIMFAAYLASERGSRRVT